MSPTAAGTNPIGANPMAIDLRPDPSTPHGRTGAWAASLAKGMPPENWPEKSPAPPSSSRRRCPGPATTSGANPMAVDLRPVPSTPHGRTGAWAASLAKGMSPENWPEKSPAPPSPSRRRRRLGRRHRRRRRRRRRCRRFRRPRHRAGATPGGGRPSTVTPWLPSRPRPYMGAWGRGRQAEPRGRGG